MDLTCERLRSGIELAAQYLAPYLSQMKGTFGSFGDESNNFMYRSPYL